MLKPDAIEADLESEILSIFKAHGIEVIRSKSIIVDEPLILEHYAEVIQRVPIEDFAQRILRAFKGKTVRIFEMASGQDDVVDTVRKIIGPTDPASASQDPRTIRE
jgi:nucleoside diphosphate kinase